MNVYEGHGRRQVGGSLWSTISRGAKPLLMSILSKIKPHAISAGKHVANSALNLGTNVAMDALSGKLTKTKLKSDILDEVDKLKTEAVSKVAGYKRKYLDVRQGGRGYKRRKISKLSKAIKSKMTKRRNTKRKAPKRKAYKRKRATKATKVIKRRKTGGRRKKRTVSHKALKDIFG